MNTGEIVTLFVNAGFSTLLSFFFYFSLSDSRRKPSFTVPIFFFALCGIASMLKFVPIPVVRIAIMLALQIVISLSVRMKWYGRILFPILFIAISGVSEYVVATLLSVVFGKNIAELSGGNLFVMGMLLSKALIFFIVLVIRVGKHKGFSSRFRWAYLPILFVPVSTVSVFIIQFDFYSRAENETAELSLPALVCYSLLLFSNVIVFYMIDNVEKSAEQQTRIKLADKLIADQNVRYENMIEQNREILRIRHDQKKFLLGLKADLDAENYSAAMGSINEVCQNIDTVEFESSPESVFHLLIEIKKSSIKDKNIDIVSDINTPAEIKIPSVDLAVLVGNALDNAVEAVEKVETHQTKTVKMTVRTHNDQIVIVITNPVAGAVDTDKAATTKKDAASHGFGILSMRKIVDKYRGDLILESTDSEFKTTMILQNKTL